jgi:hypothetical protein
MPPNRKKGPVAQKPPATKTSLDVREADKQFSFKPSDGYTQVEDCIPIANEAVPVKLRGKCLNIDSGYTLVKWAPEQEGGTSGLLTVKQDGLEKTVKAYQKSICLLNCYRWMKYKDRPSEPFVWISQPSSIKDANNQAYVDIVASSLVSKLKKQGLPHYCEFYGSIRALANKFYYNLEEDLEEVRFTKWFWLGVESGDFGLRVCEKESGHELSMDEIKQLIRPDDEFLNDDSESDESEESDESGSESSNESSSTLGAEDLPCDDVELTPMGELEEASIKTDFSESDESTTSYSEKYSFHAVLYNAPVAIMYLEHMQGTMDELLENECAPVKNSQQEVMWGAWLFQVCAALSQLQKLCGLTHNDLHTNNILWKETTEEFLYYKDSSRCWRVPTFGKIFTIIDYGRSIFLLNSFWYIGSDYNEGHDADGMYNFDAIYDRHMPKIMPNKSFDLCRLACGILRALYPRIPDANPKAAVITKDGKWEVRETNNPLFNMVWTWLKDDNSRNILETEQGHEKYPGFELYSVIAATVHSAVPEEQLNKKMMNVFLLKDKIEASYIRLDI